MTTLKQEQIETIIDGISELSDIGVLPQQDAKELKKAFRKSLNPPLTDLQKTMLLAYCKAERKRAKEAKEYQAKLDRDEGKRLTYIESHLVMMGLKHNEEIVKHISGVVSDYLVPLDIAIAYAKYR